MGVVGVCSRSAGPQRQIRKCLEHLIAIVPDVSPGYMSLDVCVYTCVKNLYVCLYQNRGSFFTTALLMVGETKRANSLNIMTHVANREVETSLCLAYLAVVKVLGLGKSLDILKFYPAVLQQNFNVGN